MRIITAIRPALFAAIAMCHATAGEQVAADAGETWKPEDRFPAWSPDGTRMAFVSDREQPGVFHLFVAAADGSGLTALTSGDRTADWPSWSPDGTFVYFDSLQEGQVRVFKIPASGGVAVPLSTGEDGNESHAALAPKGDIVAFDSNREADGLRKLYTMAPNGSRLRLVTVNAHSNSFPAWSPDGSLVAFRLRKSTFSPVSEIHLIKPDGTGLRMVTKLGAASNHPSWSPDGSRIVFVAVIGGSHEICMVTVDGEGVERITETAQNELRPTFSPDGTTILYCADAEGFFRVYRMKADGSEPTRIDFRAGEPAPPAVPEA